MSSTVFTKIIKKELPAHFLYEDEHCIAILDRNPAVKGQSLVIPKHEIDYAFDLDDDTYLHLFKTAKRIATASDKALGAVRTCLVVEGFDVPHVHIKIYPLQESDKPLGEKIALGKEASDEELKIVATQIIAAIEDWFEVIKKAVGALGHPPLFYSLTNLFFQKSIYPG